MVFLFPIRGRIGPLSRTLLAAFFLTAFMVPMAVAQAHDVLEATNPADGAIVSAVPAKISITFNHTPTAIGSKIQIKDSDGTNWASRPVDILDNVVTQDTKPGAPMGPYTVEWRIVSSDSHPIEGTFSFTANGTGVQATGPGQTPTVPNSATDASVPWAVLSRA